MTDFKINSRIEVAYDPATFARTMGQTEKWKPRPLVQRVIALDERRAVPPWNDEHPWISPFLLNSRYALEVDDDRQLYLTGAFRVPSVISEVGRQSSKTYDPEGPDFQRAGLALDQLDAIGAYRGFPVQIRCRLIKRRGQEGGSLSDVNWRPTAQLPEDQIIDYLGLGGVLELRAWLGTPDTARQRIPLIKRELLHGQEYHVTFPEDRIVTNSNMIVEGEIAPGFVRNRNSTFATEPTSTGGTAWEFDTTSFGFGIQGLAANSLDGFINGISDIVIINAPGQTDNDRIDQPQTEPENATTGPIDIDGSFASTAPPDYREMFWATVRNSRVRTLLKDSFSGFEVQRPEHRMTLEIEDRFQAGLGATPLGLGSQEHPEYQINGVGYFLIDIAEREDNELILTVSTENQT